jgi:hypothetical protein
VDQVHLGGKPMTTTEVELIGTVRVVVPIEHNGQVPDTRRLEGLARYAYLQTIKDGPADIFTESMELGEIRTIEDPLLLVNTVLKWPGATLNTDISFDHQHTVILRTGTIDFSGHGTDILDALADLEQDIYDTMETDGESREQIAHWLDKSPTATTDSRDAAL